MGRGCHWPASHRRLSGRARGSPLRGGDQTPPPARCWSLLTDRKETGWRRIACLLEQDWCPGRYDYRRSAGGLSPLPGLSMISAHKVQALKLDSIKTHHWIIIRCSAITGENLQQGLDWVIQRGRDNLFLYWSILMSLSRITRARQGTSNPTAAAIDWS